MQTIERNSGALVVVSASILCLVLGTIHAFSVFLEPLESAYAASRSTVSLTYSFALVALTIAVLFGHRLFHRLSAWFLVSLVCLVAAIGTTLAAFAGSLPTVWISYSLLFGAANGLGYSFGLQLSAQANPGREGWAMGIVTAAYALGASISPFLLSRAVEVGGLQLAMLGLTVCLLAVLPICAGLMRAAGLRFRNEEQSLQDVQLDTRRYLRLVVAYGAGVAAGLMAIGHATGIVRAGGMDNAIWIAPVIIALCNMTGSFTGGWLTDRLQSHRLLACLAVLSVIGLMLLLQATDVTLMLTALGLVGFAYGALIAAYPAAISKWFGVATGARVYARVFIAWGAAGLFAPWLAGALFDHSGDYSAALLTAGGLGLLSVAVILRERQAQS